MTLKQSISLLLTAAMLLTLPSCAPEEEINPVTPIATAESATTAAETGTTAPPETGETVRETRPPAKDKQPSLFDDYVSNTVISTGSNYMYPDADETTFRLYLPVEVYGEQTYAFYLSNTVDSTWERGRYSFAGREGGTYTIVSCRVADGGTTGRGDPTNYVDVTFGGASSRVVGPGETLWSDEVTIDIPEKHYLCYEWTLTGTDIPCIRMTELAHAYIITQDENGEDALQYNMDVPCPQMIGVKREAAHRLVCFGDSITQGAQTSSYKETFWVADVAKALGEETAVWNIGLGYARASDAALGGDWMERAKSGDVVTLAFGTNDLSVGQYGERSISSAAEIEDWLRSIIEELRAAGCTVILFNAPPFGFDGTAELERKSLNERIPKIAAETGCLFFDWDALLGDKDNPGSSLYGGHPNDAGCQVIADAFVEQFGELFF